MARKNSKNMVGGWAFLIGAILAIILGVIGSLNSTWLWILVVLGLIVGLLNVAAEESSPFLLSGAVLIIASAFGGDVLSIIPMLGDITQSLLALFVPATIVVALRNVFSLAKR